MKGRPVVFVPSADPRRAARWYVSKLGMVHVLDEPFASVLRDGDLVIRIAQSEGSEPAPFAILGWEVKDIHATVRALRKKRVKFLRDPSMVHDKLGTWRGADGRRTAWFQDRDGNVLSLTGPG